MIQLSIKQAYTFALDIFKKRWKLFLAICLVFFAVSVVGKTGESFALAVDNKAILILVSIFFWVVYVILNAFFNAGFKNILLAFVHGRIARFQDIIAPKSDAWRYLLGQLIILVAVLCLLIPGILLFAVLTGVSVVAQIVFIIVAVGFSFWLLIRFGFWAFAMLDKNIGPIEGLVYSKKITYGHVPQIIRFFFLPLLLVLIIACIFIFAFIFAPVVIKAVVAVLAAIASYVIFSVLSLMTVHLYHKVDTAYKAPSHAPHKEEHVAVRPEELESGKDL